MKNYKFISMKCAILVILGVLMVLNQGCQSQKISAGMPAIHGIIIWKGKKYYQKDNNTLDKNKIGKQLSPPALSYEKPRIKLKNIYKINGVNSSKAIALKVSVYYWKYSR